MDSPAIRPPRSVPPLRPRLHSRLTSASPALPSQPDIKTWQEQLTTLPAQTKIGLDPTLVSIADYNALVASLAASNAAELVSVKENLVDETWVGRPVRPAKPIVVHGEKYAGKSVGDKLANVRKEVAAKKAWGVVASMLDEVCCEYLLSFTPRMFLVVW